MKKQLTIAGCLQEATRQLEAAGIETARLDARVLLAHVLAMRPEEVLVQPDKPMTNNDSEVLAALVGRRCRNEPIAYITGKKEFWSLDFYVTRDTLIPRPDSETLVEAALRQVKSRAANITLLDIGTGTGCLLISLMKELPAASGVGVDINEQALQVAIKNAQAHDVSHRARFVQSNWGDAVSGVFDIIISNPPYIAEKDEHSLMPDVSQYEPRFALFAGADGLEAYRAIAAQLPALLAPGGAALFEVGAGQAADVADILSRKGLSVATPEKDMAGVERCIIARKTH